MKRATLAIALIMASGAPVGAHDYKVGNLLIDHPWARATPHGTNVGGGYLTIRNRGKAADRLLSASSPVAGRVEIHQMTMKDGIATMRPVEGGLAIAPGKTVALKTGGYHLMFMDLKAPLKKGESIPGTLVFEQAGTVNVEFKVEAIGAKPPRGHHDN
jgi:copper(I)-binding protein